MEANVRFATEADVRHIANNMQPASLREMQALGYEDPLPPLIEGLRRGKVTLVAEDAEEPFCVFGAVPSPLPDLGIVWMVNTPRMLRHRVQFIRQGRGWLGALHAHFPTLANIVHVHNRQHILWLHRLGFQFHQIVPFGPRGEGFLSFSRTNPSV